AAAAPCSGFHHARYAQVGGFCTFNGLMVTARVLAQEARIRRVGIIDCDEHYGDGTEEIIERLGARGLVRHFTAGARYGEPSQAAALLDALPRRAAPTDRVRPA